MSPQLNPPVHAELACFAMLQGCTGSGATNQNLSIQCCARLCQTVLQMLLLHAGKASGDPIPGQYVVMFEQQKVDSVEEGLQR
jgi:hypothetical protein